MNMADVLFLDVYQSIRGNWAGGIIPRGIFLANILEKTTLPDAIKEQLKKRFIAMNDSYKTNREWFDGRDWSRDTTNSYDNLKKSAWFDQEFYEKNTIYEKEYERFTGLFPVFDAKDYFLAHILPQLRGEKPKTEQLDKHSDTEFEVTERSIKDILGFEVKVKE